jgi:hypothetical protein
LRRLSGSRAHVHQGAEERQTKPRRPPAVRGTCSTTPWSTPAREGKRRRLEDPSGECRAQACAAVCQLQLGRGDVALAIANDVFTRPDGEFAERPAHKTIALRWISPRVLDDLGDARAAPAAAIDCRWTGAELTHGDGRERLMPALPVIRAVVAAGWRRQGDRLRLIPRPTAPMRFASHLDDWRHSSRVRPSRFKGSAH